MVLSFDMRVLELPVGTYQVLVKAKGTNWRESASSNGVDYVVTSKGKLIAPTISVEGNLLKIYDEEGLATSYRVLVDGEVKDYVSLSESIAVDPEVKEASDGSY